MIDSVFEAAFNSEAERQWQALMLRLIAA